MISQDVLSREMIEVQVINKFKREKDISIVCNKELAEELVGLFEKQNFKNIDIELDDDIEEYYVSRTDNCFICEPAKENGKYLFLENKVIIITEGEKLNLEDIRDCFDAIKHMWILSEKPTGQVYSAFDAYLEFG